MDGLNQQVDPKKIRPAVSADGVPVVAFNETGVGMGAEEAEKLGAALTNAARRAQQMAKAHEWLIAHDLDPVLAAGVVVAVDEAREQKALMEALSPLWGGGLFGGR